MGYDESANACGVQAGKFSVLRSKWRSLTDKGNLMALFTKPIQHVLLPAPKK
jgi:hypothetical protein